MDKSISCEHFRTIEGCYASGDCLGTTVTWRSSVQTADISSASFRFLAVSNESHLTLPPPPSLYSSAHTTFAIDLDCHYWI